MIPKSNRRSTTSTKGERSDKNEMPVKEHGRSVKPAPRGVRSINPAKVPTTAPKSL